jgi:hypothetical protein
MPTDHTLYCWRSSIFEEKRFFSFKFPQISKWRVPNSKQGGKCITQNSAG